jgi:hypothetical protein
MRAAETTAELERFERRAAGSDSERRAALWLADQFEQSGREARVEPFWCRPNWALAQAWHVALAIAGSLVAVHHPRIGGALVLAALLSVIADATLGVSPGRRLTPERASQNVVALPPLEHRHKPVRLIITANYDAGRTGLAYRDRVRTLVAALAKPFGRYAPGWLGWLAILLGWLLVIAVLRLEGSNGSAVGAAQVIPTVALVVALALLLELGTSDISPATGDNGSGTAVAIALARALDAAPPRWAAVEVVLQGAGDAGGIGLRRYLKARKRLLTASNTVVVGIAPCANGGPRWWVSDGQLVPLRYFGRLRELCAILARNEGLEAKPHRGRGATPALLARSARLPAISIGCLDDHGLVPRSHQRSDTAAGIDLAALDGAVEFGLLLVDAIDGFLRQTRSAPASGADAPRRQAGATRT